jgi:hypothetical protein
MCFYISFTGHRDKLCADGELARIAKRWPGGIWVHGGAVGFDTQVQRYAENNRIPTLIILPDYEKNKGKQAPIIRNREIAELGNVLVACYDGRKTGGTFFTINFARKLGKHIELVALRG